MTAASSAIQKHLLLPSGVNSTRACPPECVPALEKTGHESHVCLGTPRNTAACPKPRKNTPKQALNETIPYRTYLNMPRISVLIPVPAVIFGFVVK